MEFIHESERIYAQDENGNVIAEINFPIENGVATINRTFVDSSLRGQGVAGKLMKAAAEDIRKAGLKANPTCSYAVKWLAENTDYSDIM